MQTANKLGLWGAFSPSGIGKLLLQARKLGFARGPIKKLLGKAWLILGLKSPVDINYAGVKFRIFPWDNTVEFKMLFGSKQRDLPELKKLQEFVEKGGIFLDIGANIGYYSLMAAKFGASHILAFEPNPKVFSRLRFNIEANDLQHCVKALPIALGEHVETTTMYVSERDMGGSHIGDHGDSSGTPISVQMKPLLSVLQDEQINRVDALKIDVEGMEDLVLFPFFETSPKVLWPRLVIMEFTSQQFWTRDILSWLLSSGYREIERNRSNVMLSLD